MKLIELTTDLRPWRKGDNVPLPDPLADRLLASGEAVNPRLFPTPTTIADNDIMRPPLQPDPAKPAPGLDPGGKPPRRKYLIK